MSTKYLYRVDVAPGLIYDCLGEEELALQEGDEVIVGCDRYQDFGIVKNCLDENPANEEKLQKERSRANRGRHVEGQRIPAILRRATPVDKTKAEENRVKGKSMHLTAMERVQAHGLDMKLINTHCSFDRRLVVFQFAAEGRVDFRELLRDLSHKLRTRVELRQVGVRDEAAIQGGIACCGRPFCCATFLKRFVSINVKMAKIQGLSLNPANISGACGRLKCCLQYEFDRYRELRDEERAQERERMRAEAEAREAPPRRPPSDEPPPEQTRDEEARDEEAPASPVRSPGPGAPSDRGDEPREPAAPAAERPRDGEAAQSGAAASGSEDRSRDRRGGRSRRSGRRGRRGSGNRNQGGSGSQS